MLNLKKGIFLSIGVILMLTIEAHALMIDGVYNKPMNFVQGHNIYFSDNFNVKFLGLKIPDLNNRYEFQITPRDETSINGAWLMQDKAWKITVEAPDYSKKLNIGSKTFCLKVDPDKSQLTVFDNVKYCN